MQSPASLYPILLAAVDVGLGILLYQQDAVVLGVALAVLGAVVLIGRASQTFRDCLNLLQERPHLGHRS